MRLFCVAEGCQWAILTFWRIRYYLVFPFLLFICSNAIFQTPSSWADGRVIMLYSTYVTAATNNCLAVHSGR